MRMSKGVRIFVLAAFVVLAAVLILQPDRKSRLVERLGTGLSDAHSEFTARQLLEIYEGEDRTGAVRDLTNFNWDRVCAYPPYAYFGPDGPDPAEHPFYEVAWSVEEPFARIVFSEADAMRMVLKIPSNTVHHPELRIAEHCLGHSARYLFKVTEPKAGNDTSREASLPAYRSFYIAD